MHKFSLPPAASYKVNKTKKKIVVELFSLSSFTEYLVVFFLNSRAILSVSIVLLRLNEHEQ